MNRIRSDFSFIKGNFLIMVASWLVLDLVMELPGTYYPLYVKALGGTASTIGFIGAASMLASALVQIPGGYMTDKYGRRWLIVSMTFIAAIARVFYAYAPVWQWILVGQILAGFCSIYRPALTAIVADSLPEDKRGTGFSIINLIQSVSTTPAPLLAGFLFTAYGLVPSMRLSYKIAAVGFIVAALIRFRLKETVENPSPVNIREMLGAYPASLRASIDVWGLVPKAAFVVFIVGIFIDFTASLFQPVMALYVIQDLGISEVRFSYIMTALPVSMILLSIPAGLLIDRIGRRKPLMASFVFWAVAVLLLVYGSFWRVILAMVMVGSIMILVNSAGSALMADLVPKEHRGKVSGSRGFFGMIAGGLGQLSGGWMYDNISHQAPFLVEVLLVAIPFILVWRYIEEKPAPGPVPSPI